MLGLNLLTLPKNLSTMSQLHFFYPENDLALALNDVNYTAPRAAVDLRVSGEPLPMWFAAPGDKFYTQGVNAKWYDAIAEHFNIAADVHTGDVADLRPAPWGWSLPVRKYMLQLGFDECQLPSTEQIERMRGLSHRRTSALIVCTLREAFGTTIGDAAVEVDNTDDVLAYVHQRGRAMLKLPWSSSGRGVVDTFNLADDEIVRRAQGTIRRQGAIMIEPYYDSPQNFAYLFEVHGGVVTFAGYSLFDVDTHCAYSGSTVANDEILERMIAAHVDINVLRGVRDALPDVLGGIIGTDYDGAFGVDMMIADGKLAVAEMNLRMTMGHVAHALAARHVADGAVGRFTIVPRTDEAVCMPDACTIENERLVCGTIDLVPGDRRHRFVLTV
jgi:hypothetical protein